MKTDNNQNYQGKHTVFGGKHPILVNLFLIIILGALGVLIVYFSLALFTKHGQNSQVPEVENLSYSEAVEKLHDAGFRVEIRDSLYRDDLRAGLVIEQFPKAGAIAKPGRKIFLYINALHPKQVMIDEEDRPGLNAMRGMPYRSAQAHLQELGFKNIKYVRILGDSKDLVVRVLADGHPVKKRQLIPVTAHIVVEIYDGRLSFLYDSLYNIEMQHDPMFTPAYTPNEPVEEQESNWQPSQSQEEENSSGTYHYSTEENNSDPEPETIGL